MKKILLSLATVALMMSACTQDVVELEGGNVVNFDGNVGVTATMTPETRTAMADNASGGLDVTWVAEDAIGLTAEDASTTLGTNAKYTANSAAASTTFSYAGDATAIKWGTGDHTFYAYYPYTADGTDYTAVPASVPAVQKQSAANNTDHLQSLAFLYAKAETTGIPADGNIDLQFKSAFSILELQVHAEAGTMLCDALIFRADDENEIVSAEGVKVNLADGSLDYSAATTSHEIQINLGEGVELNSTEAQKFYMIITPGHAGKRFSFYAIVGGKEVLLGNKGIPAAGLPAGAKAELALNVPAIDLSAEGTANCYIVNKAATTYKFKATVKGNGATATYNWTGGGNENTRTITEGDVALTPASAKLLWTTNSATNTVVTDVTLKDGYIYFKTPASFINGNCVIAAMDASGDIVWSWHIWAVENYDDVATAKPIKSLSAMLMDRNLGATKSTEQADGYAQSEVVGLKYQWGRKDPFPAPVDMGVGDGNLGGRGKAHYSPDGSISYYKYCTDNGYELKGAVSNESQKDLYTYYDSDNGFQQLTASIFDNNFDAAVAQSIKEPWRLHLGYTNAFGVNDNGYIYSYLWGNPTGSASEGTKSIYDPCPVGWRVASTAVCDVLENSTLTYLNYGMFCGDHYMPRTGRGDFSNTWSWYGDCTSYGYLWTDKCYSDSGYGTAYVFEMTDDSQKIWAEGKYGTTSFGVRCVSEGTVDLSEYVVDLSATGTANCYIANTGDIYKFKATVKGNGVAALGSETTTITPTKARLLWAQSRPKGTEGGQPSLFGEMNTDKIVTPTSVELKDGYIHFTSGSQEGNAVIIATDNDDNVLWSWHIWVVNGYNPATSDYYVTTKGINTYMMDRNLGSFHNGNSSNFDDRMGARGLYYQWGRKDPFVGNIQYNGWAAKMTQFNADGTTISKYASYNGDRIHATIDVKTTDINGDAQKLVAWTTSHPINFLSAWGETGYSWMNGVDGTTGDWGKLWGNQANDRKGGTKTMYDPCPVGYRVPSTGHLEFITAHNEQASSSYGNNLCNWKFNCAEKIWDESGTVINGDLKAAPYGLNFYIKGVKTASPDTVDGVQDYGVLPADETTAYFPGQGLMTYAGNGFDANIYIQTNCVASDNSHWMKAENGNFYYKATSGSYDQQAKAMPVRCVRE